MPWCHQCVLCKLEEHYERHREVWVPQGCQPPWDEQQGIKHSSKHISSYSFPPHAVVVPKAPKQGTGSIIPGALEDSVSVRGAESSPGNPEEKGPCAVPPKPVEGAGAVQRAEPSCGRPGEQGPHGVLPKAMENAGSDHSAEPSSGSSGDQGADGVPSEGVEAAWSIQCAELRPGNPGKQGPCGVTPRAMAVAKSVQRVQSRPGSPGEQGPDGVPPDSVEAALSAQPAEPCSGKPGGPRACGVSPEATEDARSVQGAASSVCNPGECGASWGLLSPMEGTGSAQCTEPSPCSPGEHGESGVPPRAMEGSVSAQGAEPSPGGPGEGAAALQKDAAAQASLREAPSRQVSAMVAFVPKKYSSRVPIAKSKILSRVFPGQQQLFPAVFAKACECMQVVFGIEVREADPQAQSYDLAIALGLSYDGLLGPEQSVPKAGLLLMVLGLILLHGDCAPEEAVWEALVMMGIYAWGDHFLFGDPWELLTQEWVFEEYGVYQPVAGTWPECYYFHWGPCAHHEVCKVIWLKVNSTEPTFFL